MGSNPTRPSRPPADTLPAALLAPFLFTFHPRTGKMYASENADANCDELNIIVSGGNYG